MNKLCKENLIFLTKAKNYVKEIGFSYQRFFRFKKIHNCNLYSN